MKTVLDPCCGSKMFWFDKHDPRVEFCDKRKMDRQVLWEQKDGKKKAYIEISPDTVCDVTNLPFADNSFWHVILDPPHLVNVNQETWTWKKYGNLPENWQQFIHDAFVECMRVLKPNGTLVFKWSEPQISIRDILSSVPYKPLYGNRQGKRMTTHWIVFIKEDF